MRKYILIIGLACCVSCSTNDPQKGSKTRTEQTAATHQDETWHYTAKEEDLKGAQQPVIKECG